MVGLLLPSDFLGRPNRESAPYDVTATTDLQLCCFRRTPFLEGMMDETPHIAQRLLEMTLDELDAAREWMLLLGRKTAREKDRELPVDHRAARRDLQRTRRDGRGGLRPAADAGGDGRLPRPDAGDGEPADVGLKKDGVIQLEGKRHIVIPDFDLLLDETGDDSDGGILS
jgi:CRP/FNR family transcriptional regulator